MRYQTFMGQQVAEAIRQDLCVMFTNSHYYYRDEGHNQWRRGAIIHWLDSAADIKYKVIETSQSTTAFIFRDHFYKKLFMLYFGIKFKWD